MSRRRRLRDMGIPICRGGAQTMGGRLATLLPPSREAGEAEERFRRIVRPPKVYGLLIAKRATLLALVWREAHIWPNQF